ncbi:hypothetical protein SAMN02745975_02612 [Geosporobacter subterraneus DSM 17957]|uniref:Uncharacterized protein n=1 Tax=Geosporobacter subterraneus DSM 17957 TaxID=1121919 RepID=A0A1M6L947_9FIRM|nr:hypothetical protein [Geosporobacter subterraneus]SHJ67716.1 hypothetical protein SAMN02745975_02612 [Geosporobacter subterraneus DSM 17957]
MEENKRLNFGANEAQNLIDSTYNTKDYPIIEKTQNAYLMPESMQRDVDCINTFRFYEDTTEYTEALGIEGIPASPESKKSTKLQ